MSEDISIYLSGSKLYGDDFSLEEIEKWYEDEAEGYANLGAKEKKKYHYGYHELNKQNGYKYLLKKKFNEVLGIGSAYGDEFKPIIDEIGKITILDPSEAFSNVQEILGTPSKYVKPTIDGSMKFDNDQFDLVTSFGVLHHIPNVSYVMSECYRCLNKGGIMLLREPIVSMGDWTKPRAGLTKRERGIPLKVLKEIVKNCGFKIKKENLCVLPIIPKLAGHSNFDVYNNYALTKLDKIISNILPWKISYHRIKLSQRFSPASVYFVLVK